jgi:hypothetical protein
MAQDAGLRDVAASAGIALNTPSYGVEAADYDRDGRPDFLYNGDWKTPLRLFRNQGGRFAADTRTNFGQADRLGCAWGDANQDGRLDFYCSVGAVHGTATKANQLWIQQADGRFVDQAAGWGVTDPLGRGRDVVWLNYNGDRYPDLFVGNHFPRVDRRPTPNRLFVNQGGSRLVEVRIDGLTAELGGYSAHAADLDRNGYDDLLVTGKAGRLMVYRDNRGSGYRDVASSLGLGNAMYVTTADVTGNGLPDIILVTRSKGVCVAHNQGAWRFVKPTCYGSQARSAVGVKMRPGGIVDIYAARGGRAPNNLPDMLLRNNGRGQFTVFTVGASTKQGLGERSGVAAIDHDRDGRDGVLVANAAGGTAGPLQLMVPTGPR